MIAAKEITRNIVKKCHSRFFSTRIRDPLQIDAKHIMSSNNAPAEVRLQVLGSGSRAGSTSLILITDRKRYMFNCGEGIQRLATEHKTKLSKIQRIFITSGIWKNLGGLPGVVFTIQSLSDEMKDESSNVVNITAPKRTEQMLKILRESNIMKKLLISVDELETIKQYEDNVMTVSCIPVYSNVNGISYKCMSETITNNSTDNGIIYTNTSEKRKTNEIRTDKRIKLNKDILPVLSYICKFKDKLGALCLEKCLAKGVKPGPILGFLKNGKNVTLDDGTIVRHEEVCSPKEKGSTFVVVDCPNENYLESFINEAAFIKHQKNASDENDKPYCIIHFTPQEIIDNPKYKEWMNNFDSNTYHLIINESNTCLGSQAVYKQQHMLNVLNPEIFPFLQSNCFQNQSNVKSQQNLNTDNNQRIHYAKTLQTIEFRPEKKFNTDTMISVDRVSYTNELLESKDFSTILEEYRSNINEQTRLVFTTEEYPKFVLLGTGSSIPSKIRNTSAILVRIDESSSILLDCSEGTLSQIARVYGLTKLDHILSTIKAIYVSHMHADHHLGLIGVILARAKVTKDPIFLLMPDTLKSWMNYCYERFDPIEDYVKYISNEDFLAHRIKPEEVISMKKDLCEKLNIKKLETTLVRHCNLSYGIALTFENDKKVVYSGDTMPCNSIIQLGMNCDLLIHEATLQDELAKEAQIKKHSTVSDAIRAGEKMRSGFTLLTHFSQRNAKIPVIPEKSKLDLSKVAVAFDYMHFNLSQIKYLPPLYSYLKIIFQNNLILSEERLVKKLQNKFE